MSNEAVAISLLASVEALGTLPAHVLLQEMRSHVIMQRMRSAEPLTAPMTDEWIAMLLLQRSNLKMLYSS